MGSGLSVSSSMTIATGGNGGGGAAGVGRAPLPSHCAAFKSRASDLSAGFTLQAYSLASMPCGNLTR